VDLVLESPAAAEGFAVDHRYARRATQSVKFSLNRVWPTLAVVSLFVSSLMAISSLAIRYESSQVIDPASVDAGPSLSAIRTWSAPNWNITGSEALSDQNSLGCQKLRLFAWNSTDRREGLGVVVAICGSTRAAEGALHWMTNEWVGPSAAATVRVQEDAAISKGWLDGDVAWLLVTKCSSTRIACDQLNSSQVASLSARLPTPTSRESQSPATWATKWGVYAILSIPVLGLGLVKTIRRRGLRRAYPKLAPAVGDVQFNGVGLRSTQSQARRNAHHAGLFGTVLQLCLIIIITAMFGISKVPWVLCVFWILSIMSWRWGRRDPRTLGWLYKYTAGESSRSSLGIGWVSAARIGFTLWWLSEAALIVGFFLASIRHDVSTEVYVLRAFFVSPLAQRLDFVALAFLLVAACHGFVFLSLILVAALPLLNLAFRHGRRLQSASAKEVQTRDSRPHFLLLRSFDEDEARIPAEYIDPGLLPRPLSLTQTLGFEEVLAQGLSRFGPVYAINPPGNKLPELGAAKMTLTDGEWRDQVKDYSAAALAIVVQVTPGKISREGFGWELDYLRLEAGHERIIAVLGPWPPADKQERWNRFRSSVVDGPLAELANIPQPGGLRIAARSLNRGWQLFGGIETTDITYLQAIQAAVGAFGESWRQEFVDSSPHPLTNEPGAKREP
jgi:hypothetical protein